MVPEWARMVPKWLTWSDMVKMDNGSEMLAIASQMVEMVTIVNMVKIVPKCFKMVKIAKN